SMEDLPVSHSLPLNVSGIAEFMPQFHMMFDDAQIGITVAARDGTIIYYNRAQSEIDGVAPAQVLGRRMYEVYSYTPEESPTMQVLRSGEAIVDSVHYYRTRRGRLVNASCAIYPLYSGGELLGAMCYIQSYSAHEMHLRRIQGELTALESTEDGRRKKSGRSAHYTFSSLVGESRALQDSVALARMAAKNASSVMLIGETGVGKEIFAQSIHYEGPRKKYPYTAINCSAVPETLLEGILFGTTRGAFTGATDKAGLFEASDRGTLFFDEADSMPIGLQSKLLRVLQERKVRRIGDARERDVDVRIISSVGKNPLALLNDGMLRSDFYYRIGVIKVAIPPLRERMDDLHGLIRHFLRKHSAAMARSMPLVTPEALAMLYAHNWPGNVRELEHALEAALGLMGDDDSLEAAHIRRACPDIAEAAPLGSATAPWLAYRAQEEKKKEAERNRAAENRLPFSLSPSARPFPEAAESPVGGQDAFVMPVAQSGAQSAGRQDGGLVGRREEAEKEAIRSALARSAGQRSVAARLLGVSPQLLYYKLKKYGINAGAYRPDSGA
ncbi:sigma 54-interacting transcriptional regulator, partial [Desulfovibrio sp. OttesenSCG-928-I05]|nr:sigma 54-interacting transcriptional regulator [Desulfovibrio sp. OttesenSCG-928-I05]